MRIEPLSQHPFLVRLVAALLVPLHLLTGNAVVLAQTVNTPSSAASPTAVPGQPKVPSAPSVAVAPRKSIPKHSPPVTELHFSRSPSQAEISAARVFEEPLIPDGKTTADENQALVAALVQYSTNKSRVGLAGLEAFVKHYPRSAWRGSVQADLGLFYRKHGYYSRALDAWEAAWQALKASTVPEIHPLADRVAGELSALASSLGRLERLDPLLRELEGRPIYGSAVQQLKSTRQNLWLMKNRPGKSFKCGPYALDSIRTFENPANAHAPEILKATSPATGFSLDQVQALSNELKMGYQMAQRSPGSQILTPAVVHWKSGHYAAVLKQHQETYLVKDPTFGRPVHLTADAINDESDGYFLVRNGALPEGWQTVSEAAAKSVWGRGLVDQYDSDATGPDQMQIPDDTDPDDTDPNDPDPIPIPDDTNPMPIPDNPNPCPGMARCSVLAMLLSISISDIPLFYRPAIGPQIKFRVTINQLEANQPGVFTYSNLGPLAVHNWMSFVTAPDTLGETAYVNTRGGGRETYGTFTSANTPPSYIGSYAPESQSHATLWVTAAGNYERHLPNGANEIYATPDGTGRIFLNQVVDPQGNAVTLTYDNSFRIVAITDAMGLVTTLSYDLAADPLKITKVTDPFGRFSSFGYTPAATYVLTSITDEIGITSQFNYINGDTLSSLVTPYGSTSFIQNLGYDLSLQITDPKGQTECYKSFLDGGSPISDSDPALPTGYGLSIYNGDLTYLNTFYWNKITVGQYGTLSSNTLGDGYYGVGHIYHWLLTDAPTSASPILASEKRPLESRVWYNYAGQPDATHVGTDAKPTIAARLLDDGSTQAYQHSYNSLGKVTQAIDPVGRTLANSYYPNGIDRFQTTQTTNGANDLLATYTWNSQHRPLTYTDAAGQTTTYTWNAQGQTTSVTDALNETTTYSYYTADVAGKQRNGRLNQITGPLPDGQQITTFDYDAYGNVASVTGPDGYCLQFAYDALSRLVQVTYPDGTTTQTTYNLLDPSTYQDRLGRVTSLVYNNLRQLTSVTDPAGRTTQYTWCKCGALSQLIDPLNNVTRWKHDLEGRTTAKRYTDGSEVTYNFGANSGRLLTITDEHRQVKTRNYNLDNTLSGVTYSNCQNPTPNVSFSYDPAYRRVSSMTDGIGATTYAYNPVNGAIGAAKLASVTGPWTNSTITYGYDALGRVSSRAINGVAETAHYDAAGRLGLVTNALGSFSYGYDGDTARVSSATHSGGVKSVLTYYPKRQDHRLQSITNYQADGVTPVSIFSYTSDDQNRIQTWTKQQGAATATATVSTYGYDNADQLMSDAVTKNGSADNSYGWQYDLAGNRTEATLNGVAATSGYNSLNQQVNTTANLPVMTYEWDAENRLTAINNGSNRSEFTYDGLGRRVQIVEKTNGAITSTTSYLWDALKIREQRDATGTNVRQRYYGQGFQSLNGANQGIHLYTRDHLGSIREIVDTTGALQERISYDDWGNPSFSDVSPMTSFTFTGFFFHEFSGLQLAPYRAYNAGTGRWLSRDPLAERGGLNLYAYVGNNPSNLIDPKGELTPFVGLTGILIVLIGQISYFFYYSTPLKLPPNLPNPNDPPLNYCPAANRTDQPPAVVPSDFYFENAPPQDNEPEIDEFPKSPQLSPPSGGFSYPAPGFR